MPALQTIARVSDQIVDRARAEYLEMPGLCLTVPQAARLLGVTTVESQRVLSALLDGGLLRRDPNGAYRRRPCPRCA
jgi:Fic family protein